MSDEATFALADAISRLAMAMDKLAESSPGVGGLSGPPPAPGAPGGKPERSVEQKMAAKVFAICKQNDWSIADIGQRVLNRAVSEDSRTWTKADLSTVLRAMKEWGFA